MIVTRGSTPLLAGARRLRQDDSRQPPRSHCLPLHPLPSAAMVSATGSQVSSARPPCTAARSMRTVRRPAALREPGGSSAPGESDLFDDSESDPDDLSDSVIDSCLFELAAVQLPAPVVPAVKPPSLSVVAPAVAGVDRSRDLSDYSSSFSSDISGELERLAAVPNSDGPWRPASEPLGFVESLELPDSAPLNRFEPAVRACVSSLSPDSPAEAKRAAAARLRLLAKHRSDIRELIGASGAIPALVPLLRSTDPAAQENATTALLNLSLEERNREAITAAGAIKPLVYALRTGTAAAKQNAACALLSLSVSDDNRVTIGACGAIPPLVALLTFGSARGKKDALTTLYRLCSTRRNKERAVNAGAVLPLISLIGERSSGMSEKAMVVLDSLAGVEEGQEAILEAGGIAALVDVIEDGPARGKEFAVVVLLQLCVGKPRNCALLVREGAIPPLVALSQSGSARGKHKAETLLGYLREQR